MVTGSSLLKATGGFTWSLTSGSRGVSRSVHKLVLTPTIIKKEGNFEGPKRFY